MVATANGQTDVKFETLAGKTVSGSLESIDQDGTLVGNFNQPGPWNLADLSQLQTSVAAQPAGSATRLVPINGGSVVANSVIVTNDQVQFASELGDFAIPLQALSAIIWNDSDTVQEKVKAPSKENDTVVVDVNGQLRTVEGLFESLNGAQLGINYQDESRTIGVEKIAALIMADLGFEPLRGTIATLTMSDGSVVNGQLDSLKNDELKLRLSNTATLTLPTTKLVSISIRSDRVQYLSALEPATVRESSDFVLARRWKKNQSVAGNPLRLQTDSGIESFSRGLGVQASSELGFANEGFDRFQALVGIDAETNGLGNCLLEVRGDGIKLWSQEIKGGQRAVSIDVKITGIRQVVLIVKPGQEFDLADHVDWCNPRFLKDSADSE